MRFLVALFLLSASSALAQSSCTFTFDPAGPVDAPRAGGKVAVVKLTASAADCPYQLRGPEWINIDYNQRGVGSSEFGFTIRANTSVLPRASAIIAGNSQMVVVQRGCSYSVTPSSVSAPNAGASGTFSISGDCAFAAASQSPWLTISRSTENPRLFSYTVAPNQTGSPRNAEVWVGPPDSLNLYHGSLSAPPIFRVRQGEILIPGSALVTAPGGTFNISVNVQPGVSWTATTQTPWITILAGSSGVGPGIVSVRVFANTGAEPRNGELFIAGRTFSLTQEVSGCSYALSQTSASISSAGGELGFDIATECAWSASTGVSWLTIQTLTGRGPGRVQLTVAPNPRSTPRSATVTVGGLSFTVNQEANPCNFSLSPSGAAVNVVGGSGTLRVSGGSGCSWSAATVEDWIEVRSTSIAGGEISYIVLPNYSAEPRIGVIDVAGAAFTITQAGRGPQIATAAVLNAASFVSGPVAPGEIVTLFGQGMGPTELVPLQLSSDGRVATSLGGVRLFFDEVEAPLVFVLAGQIGAVVPYEMSGKSSARVHLEYQGAPSNTVTVPIASSSPGIFTSNASGSGQGAILNEDGSINSASNPARPGSIVVLYATGEGDTNPPGVTGVVTGADLSRPLLSVTVRIGGADAEVLYAGSAPGLVAGAFQVNVRVPAGTSAGDIPVELGVGEVSSGPGVTVAVAP